MSFWLTSIVVYETLQPMGKQTIDEIYETLKTNGPMTQEQIHRRIRNSSQYAYRALRTLVLRNLVTKVNDKYIAKTEEEVCKGAPVGYYLPLPNTPFIQACFKSQAPATFHEDVSVQDIERLAERYTDLATYFYSLMGKLEYTGAESTDKEAAVAKLKAYVRIVQKELENVS